MGHGRPFGLREAGLRGLLRGEPGTGGPKKIKGQGVRAEALKGRGPWTGHCENVGGSEPSFSQYSRQTMTFPTPSSLTPMMPPSLLLKIQGPGHPRGIRRGFKGQRSRCWGRGLEAPLTHPRTRIRAFAAGRRRGLGPTAVLQTPTACTASHADLQTPSGLAQCLGPSDKRMSASHSRSDRQAGVGVETFHC